MPDRVVGLGGLAGSGKSSIALALRSALRERGVGGRILSFAEPLKEMLRTLYAEAGMPMSRSEFALHLAAAKETPEAILGGRTPRHALQTLGTEWGRDLMSPTLWVAVAARKLDSVDKGVVAIFDDVRFPSERDMILGRGGICLHVRRPGVEQAGAHVSEGYAFRPVLRNDETPGDAAESIVRRLRDARLL